MSGAYRSGPHPSPWRGARAALDILLNNAGVGLAMAAGVAALAAYDAFEVAVWAAFAVAWAVVLLDVALLAADLGDPTRFFHMLRVVKVRTPMSVGVWSLTALLAVLTPLALLGVVAAVGALPSWGEAAVRVLAAAALVPGAGALLYKGVLFSVTAQPGWRDARSLGAYACASGVALGMGGLLAAVIVAGARVDAPLRAAGVALALLAGLPLVLLRREVAEALRARFTPGAARAIDGAALLLAVVVPAAVLALAGGAAAVWTALCASLAGALLVRLALVALPRARTG